MADAPQTNLWSDKIRPFKLHQTTHAPLSVAMSRWVANPNDAVDGGARAVMDSRRGDSQLIVDFGKELVGSVAIRAEALQETSLTIYYGEDMIEAMRREEFGGEWYRLPRDEIEIGAGRCTLKNKGRRAFRYVHLFIPEGKGSLAVENMTATLVHYPVEKRGRFSSSDPLLNKMWEVSERTTLLCMQQFYEDGIKRDGCLWIGDYRVQYLCNALCFGDAALARKSLYMMAASQMEGGSFPACAAGAGGHQHPFNIDYMPTLPQALCGWGLINYSADFVGCVKEYYEYTGDIETVRDLWPSVTKLLPYLYGIQKDGPDIKSGFLTDCPTYKEGFWLSSGTLSMQLYAAVRDAAALSQIVGDASVRPECDEFMSKQKDMIMSTFYSPAHGIFFDASDPAEGTSWHVNAQSIVSGIISDKAQARELLERVSAESNVRRPCAGFMEFWMLTGKFLAGLGQEALDDAREYWGYMLGHNATTFWDLCDPTIPEGIDHSLPEHALSQCHGWSAGPCYLFPAFVLGLQPAEPGFGRVKIRPQLAGLEWAEGVVPTPHGDIFIHWEASPELHGYITLPDGVRGKVELGDGEKAMHVQEGENEVNGQRTTHGSE